MRVINRLSSGMIVKYLVVFRSLTRRVPLTHYSDWACPRMTWQVINDVKPRNLTVTPNMILRMHTGRILQRADIDFHCLVFIRCAKGDLRTAFRAEFSLAVYRGSIDLRLAPGIGEALYSK